jgi:hypothetical protein
MLEKGDMTLIGIGSKLPNSFRIFYWQLFIKSKQITWFGARTPPTFITCSSPVSLGYCDLTWAIAASKLDD